LVGVHPEAHGATGGAPLEPGLLEHQVEAFLLRLSPDRIDPGTTIARIPGRTRRPATTVAANRRSSIRLLVQDPMNTVSTAMSRIAVPASSPM
jgi:hypothetical protein